MNNTLRKVECEYSRIGLTHRTLEVFHFEVKNIKNFASYGVIRAGWVEYVLNPMWTGLFANLYRMSVNINLASMHVLP